MKGASEKPAVRSWRDAFPETLSWLAFVFFLLTLPVSFPLLVLYKKVRGEKLRGKGAGIFFLLWVGMTAILAFLVAVYVEKGFTGLRTLLWIGLFGTIWGLIVWVAMRLILVIFVAIFKIQRWLEKKFKK